MENPAKNPPPYELLLSINISKYGPESILGRRVLSYGEINRIGYVAMMIGIQNDPERKANMAIWASDHPEQAEVYIEARKLAYPE